MPAFNSLRQVEDSDYSGLFMGTVVDNNDPLKLQRVKVDVLGALSAPYPWALNQMTSTFGTGGAFGVCQVPAVGSKVYVMFQGSNPNFPVLCGFVCQADAAPTPAELATNYPNRRGWKDPQGNLFYVDGTAGKEDVLFKHKSGTTLNIHPNGSITIRSVSSIAIDCTNFSVNASGAVSTKAGSTIALESGSTTSIAASAINGSGPATLADGLGVSGSLKNNGINVGSTHVHKGIKRGNDPTDPPV